MIDTHCHLTFDHYSDRVADVLDEAAEFEVAGAITVSTTSANALQGLALAQQFDNVWCSAGIHPLNCDEPIHWPDVLTVIRHERCVAWGELGLDNHYDEPARELQDRVLMEQLGVIVESGIDKPIIVHCRDAFTDLLPVFRACPLPGERFVFHCFTGDENDARAVLDFGAWISLTGVVTFKNGAAIRKAARLIPDDRLMIETDAPFLTPEPFRKVHPTAPRYSIETARFVAELRATDWETFHQTINENTARFFAIPLEQCVVSG